MLGVVEGLLLSCLVGRDDTLGWLEGWLLGWLDGCVDMLGWNDIDGFDDGNDDGSEEG